MIVLLQRALAFFGFVYMSGGLTLLLTPTGSEDSPLTQLLGIAIGGLSVLALLFTPRPRDRPKGVYWPILIVLAFAVLSVAWAVDFALALRRSGALILTAMFAVWLTETFSPRQIISILVAALITVCLSSFIAIFAFPEFGVHQATNILAETSIGAWRGLYNHKNELGRVVAIAAVLFLICALMRRQHRWVYILAYAQAIVLIVGSRSSQALVLLLLCSAAAILLVFLRHRTAAERALALIFLIPFGVVVYMLSDILAGEVLGALGKDITLSARTEIWQVVIDGMRDNFLLGGGYGSGWELVKDQITQRFGRSIGHAHNGYLQLVVEIGVVGMALTFAVMIHTGLMAFVKFMRGRQSEFACFWVAYLVLFLAGNIAASFALEYNSIDLVMFVMAPNLLHRAVPASTLQPEQIGETDLAARWNDGRERIA
jgi:O-antigen ligase